MVQNTTNMASGNHEIGSQTKLYRSRGCSKGKEKGIVLTIRPELQHGEGMGSEGVLCMVECMKEG